MKAKLTKVVNEVTKDLKAFVATLPLYGRVGVFTSFESREARGGYGPYEMANIHMGKYEFRVVGDVSKNTIGVGIYSGPHHLRGIQLPPRGTVAAFLKELARYKEWLTEEAQKAQQQAEAAAAPPGLGDIRSRLRSLRLGPGGKVRAVEQNSPTEWSVEPTNRERLDHYGNDGEGWDDESWGINYAGPVGKAAQGWLDQEFGAGLFEVDVGEKGHVHVFLTPKGKQTFK